MEKIVTTIPLSFGEKQSVRCGNSPRRVTHKAKGPQSASNVMERTVDGVISRFGQVFEGHSLRVGFEKWVEDTSPGTVQPPEHRLVKRGIRQLNNRRICQFAPFRGHRSNAACAIGDQTDAPKSAPNVVKTSIYCISGHEGHGRNLRLVDPDGLEPGEGVENPLFGA